MVDLAPQECDVFDREIEEIRMASARKRLQS